MQPEARLQQRIVRAFKQRGWAAYRIRPHGVAGFPDIQACAEGRAVYIEVKAPSGGKPTRLQRARLDELEAAGGITGVARSVEQALAIVEAGLSGATP